MPSPLRLAHQATETASQTTADLDTSFEEFNKLLADGVKQTDDLGNDVKKLMKEHWDSITNFSPLIGLALFALTLFLFAVALVGGAAWLTCPGSQPPTRPLAAPEAHPLAQGGPPGLRPLAPWVPKRGSGSALAPAQSRR